MSWLSKLFGDQSDDYRKQREQYTAATAPALQKYQAGIESAAPVDQAFSSGFGARYTNLGREQAATQAAGRYASALAPAQMQTAGGRAQTAAVVSQTRAAVAQAEAQNALGLETAQLELGQRNWQNKFQYAGLAGQGYNAAAGQASAQSQYDIAGLQSKGEAMGNIRGLVIGAASQMLGPTMSGIGTAIANRAGVGVNPTGSPAAPSTSSPSSYFSTNNSRQPMQLQFANGGSTRERRMIVGDPQRNGRPNPEMIINPTGAPLRIVPLQDMGRQQLPAMRRFAYGTEMTPRLVKRRRR
jgi:hypothetical protein